MARRGVERFDTRIFDHVPGIHHQNPLRQPRHNAQIMGNPNHGHAEGFLQLFYQIRDLRLDGDIQRRGGFVGNQQHGVAGKCHSDHSSLAHPAGKLMRIVVKSVLGIGNTHHA